MKQRKAFTLIELLVVIAIIALLLSILMPSLRKAKLVARDVVCRSHLKSWGVAWSMYFQDNSNKIPAGQYSKREFDNAGNKIDNNYDEEWYKLVEPYYGSWEIRFCPAASPDTLAQTNAEEEAGWRSRKGRGFTAWGHPRSEQEVSTDKNKENDKSNNNGSFARNMWVATAEHLYYNQRSAG